MQYISEISVWVSKWSNGASSLSLGKGETKSFRTLDYSPLLKLQVSLKILYVGIFTPEKNLKVRDIIATIGNEVETINKAPYVNTSCGGFKASNSCTTMVWVNTANPPATFCENLRKKQEC